MKIQQALESKLKAALSPLVLKVINESSGHNRPGSRLGRAGRKNSGAGEPASGEPATGRGPSGEPASGEASAGAGAPTVAESHFRVLIVSDRFKGLSSLKRHQTVHQIVKQELQIIHAFSQSAFTAEEWTARGGEIPASPPCQHKKQDS